jgi:hypothetical protein
MKLVIVTSVEEFEKEVLKLFKEAGIGNFSATEIDGYKIGSVSDKNSSWFPSVKSGNESHMFFAYTEDKEIQHLFELIKQFNKTIETNNLIRAIVLPIESFI